MSSKRRSPPPPKSRRASSKKSPGQRPLREDLITAAALEAYGSVRHEGRLSDRALEFTLRNRKQLFAAERRSDPAACRAYARMAQQEKVTGLWTLRLARAYLAAGRIGAETLPALQLAASAAPEDIEIAAGVVYAAALQTLPDDYLRWTRTNVRRQRQPGYVCVTARLPLGDFTAGQAQVLADLADSYGDGTVRLTIDQNVMFRWIPAHAVRDLYERLSAAKLAAGGAGTIADVTSCPGAETCRIAVTQSRGLGRLLIEHLSAALGHGGRTRRSADATERARSAVTHRIRSAIRQIAGCHPGLGAHLERAVSTGVYCSYRPEHAVMWAVD